MASQFTEVQPTLMAPNQEEQVLLRQILGHTISNGISGGAGLTDAQLRASPVPVSISSDIEIGAVELKNGADDQRATITTRGSLLIEGAQADDSVLAENPALVGGATADPAALPANTVAGRLKRLLTNLKGILLVVQADLNRVYDNVTSWAEPVTLVNNTAAAGTLLVRASAGVVISVEGVINAAAARYIQLHDAAATPSGGAVPFCVGYVPSGISNFSFKVPRNGYPVVNGCQIVISSTLATYTDPSVTEMFATATHRAA
jgi:hypothetical protein